MAKKKASKATASSGGTTSVKAVFQLRLDANIHQRLAEAAEEAEISLNQLIGGILDWASKNIQQGEPFESDGFWQARPQAGCVFFGRPGHRLTEAERRELKAHLGEDPGNADKGEKIFWLDFTERRVVRKD